MAGHDTPTKWIFLTGSPLPENLVWDEEGLLNSPIPPFNGEDICAGEAEAASATHPVRWRVLQGSRRASATTADPLRGSEEALFLTPRDLNNHVASAEDSTLRGGGGASAVEDPAVLSQFYNHSSTVYETSAALPAESPNWESSGDSSVQTSSTGISIHTAAGQGGGIFPPIWGTISDLKDIPNAAHLHSIIPQTITVNLVVGVIAVYPRRRVLTRWQRELDIVELIVGDNTKTGFGVTIWLPPAEETTTTSITSHVQRGAGGGLRADDALGQAVAALRPRDVVLLRTVGLSSFRDRVYGQSLRHGLTQIDLLYRQPVDLGDRSGIYTSRALDAAGADDLRAQKVRRVRDWIRHFVGSGPDAAGGGRDTGMSSKPARLLLPPDTQE
ncbi:hypothetical protein AN5587.2 [Paecilomyces variotii No. 5]|uniref:Uncharacterized protein n=1 Tax=Byssochlamys spectabilis (strain No. 5 / NBRC 109023) TaxID=1356009 RepID=V5G863_BYSSN|nr:hypothetical protein AN5587.2 [Paecilomyces variotii No. 5]